MPSRMFPVEKTQFSHIRDTQVVWDMDGYSIPAESLCPYSIKEQIKRAIEEEGFHGDVSFRLHCDSKTWPDEWRRRFWRGGFLTFTCDGGELASRFTLVADLVYWSFITDEPTNLLILSENKDKLEKDGKFSRLCKALENKGITITTARPGTFFDPNCKISHVEDDQEPCGCSEETCLAE